METDVIDAQTRGRDYHNEICAERDALRAEVERLTRERDWHKSLTQSHDLLADNAALKARAEVAEQQVAILVKEVAEWRSRPDALRADKAERKLTMAIEALSFISNKQDLSCVANIARATLAKLEKNDG